MTTVWMLIVALAAANPSWLTATGAAYAISGPEPRIIQLAEQGGSGVAARSLINPETPTKTEVQIRLEKGDKKSTYSASIRFGVCSDPGGVAYKLNPVQSGVSITELPVSISVAKAGEKYRPLAIIVSRNDDGPALACGDFMALAGDK